MSHTSRWHLQGSAEHSYSGEEARQLLRHRWDWATQETRFENEAGHILTVVTNGQRARVVLLNENGDLGEHLIDPRGTDSSGGYPLSNGQSGTHADRETVTFEAAGHAVAHLIAHGVWPPEVTVERGRPRGRS
ncbi:hypothetical protein [Streptomyces virginiae]|uniref:hypothetical protein n=1 Tax=Streptomyces virginiae TaxID=1961 RepID=UPI0022545509|nr:hypothetical protein [Streptomyces virginiae]MCX5174184.1 hypothetical protein [Streptomyces virginiae]